MLKVRTDLASEAHALWKKNAEATTQLGGVRAADNVIDGFTLTTVDVLDEEGEQALGKPIGRYVTLNLDPYIRREQESFNRAVTILANELNGLLSFSSGETVLVVGLGNNAVTPDSLGPKVLESTMITRHLIEKNPGRFNMFRMVSALCPGVLGTTGIESAEVIKPVVDATKPDRVIVIDALASRKMCRVCNTVQISNTGIIPGSGIGNARAAFNRQSLGVPVVSVGVPTVVDAATLAADLAEQAGFLGDYEDFAPYGRNMIVTPNDIDTGIRDTAKIVAYGINLALHRACSIDDITMFLS